MNTHPEAFAEPAEKRLGNRNPLGEDNREAHDNRKAGVDDGRTEVAASENTTQDSTPLRTAKVVEAIPAQPRHHQSLSRRDTARSAANDKCSRLNCATGVWRYAAGYWFL